MNTGEVLLTTEKTQAMKDALRRLDKTTAAIINNQEQVAQWTELFHNRELADNLLVSAGLVLVRLRQVRQAYFFPINEITHEELLGYEKLSFTLANSLLAGIPMDSSVLFMPSLLDEYDSATDNNGGRMFSYLARMTALFRNTLDPMRAIAEALKIGATGYEQNVDAEEFFRERMGAGKPILLATAYSSGVPLTCLMTTFGARSGLAVCQENILIRPFHFDDLLEKKQDDSSDVTTLVDELQTVSGIIRFDDASQRNERLGLEGSSMRKMAKHLIYKYPGVPIFNHR